MRTRLIHQVKCEYNLAGSPFLRYYCGFRRRESRAIAEAKETWLPERLCMRCLRAMRNHRGDAFVSEKGLPLIGPLQGYSKERVNTPREE